MKCLAVVLPAISPMNTESKPEFSLDTREAMLETLHMAYQFVLDEVARSMSGRAPTRLSDSDERELGRRLAQYWSMKAEWEDKVTFALGAVAESDKRMNEYSPEQRALLEAQARALAAQSTSKQ